MAESRNHSFGNISTEKTFMDKLASGELRDNVDQQVDELKQHVSSRWENKTDRRVFLGMMAASAVTGATGITAAVENIRRGESVPQSTPEPYPAIAPLPERENIDSYSVDRLGFTFISPTDTRGYFHTLQDAPICVMEMHPHDNKDELNFRASSKPEYVFHVGDLTGKTETYTPEEFEKINPDKKLLVARIAMEKNIYPIQSDGDIVVTDGFRERHLSPYYVVLGHDSYQEDNQEKWNVFLANQYGVKSDIPYFVSTYYGDITNQAK